MLMLTLSAQVGPPTRPRRPRWPGEYLVGLESSSTPAALSAAASDLVQGNHPRDFSRARWPFVLQGSPARWEAIPCLSISSPQLGQAGTDLPACRLSRVHQVVVV